MTPGKAVVGLALVLAVSSAALAQNTAPASASMRGKNAWMTVVTQPLSSPRQNAEEDSPATKLVTIFNSLASKYRKGMYWCCSGYNVMGPNSGVGVQWMAAPFTPSANHSVTKIQVAAGYGQQGQNGIVVSLNADSGGAPGTALETWNVSGLSRFGDCCGLVTVTDSNGIAVTGGQQYWIVLSTNSSEQDTVDAWNFEDADQVDAATLAAYTGTSWTVFQATPGVGFGVFGK